jgi:hypothetical membrane protein
MTYYKNTVHHSKVVSLVIFVLFLLVVMILPYFSYEGYSIVSNTTSHLGAQGSPHAWLMNVTFALLGARSMQLTSYHNSIAIRLFGLMFGTSLILTGVFSHAPLIVGIEVNEFLDTTHSWFATTTGFSFTLMAITSFFTTKTNQRWIALIMVVIAIVLPLSMLLIPSWMGMAQRLMFVSGFLWIFFGEISLQRSSSILKKYSVRKDYHE